MEKLRKMWGWDATTRGQLEFRVLKIEKSQACWLQVVWPSGPASPAHRVNTDWLALWPTCQWEGQQSVSGRGSWPAGLAQPQDFGCPACLQVQSAAAASPARQVNRQWLTGPSSCPLADKLRWRMCSWEPEVFITCFQFKFGKGAGDWSLADCGSGSMCHPIYCILDQLEATWTRQ